MGRSVFAELSKSNKICYTTPSEARGFRPDKIMNNSVRGLLTRGLLKIVHWQWRIQDFPQGGAPTPKIAIIFQIFAENCMKTKEFGPPGGARVPGAPLGSANDWYSNLLRSFQVLLPIKLQIVIIIKKTHEFIET